MDLGALLRILEVAFGIGLVIFVHEAGHFLAARLCGVRVEVFSIGFGRRIFGWRRGSTLYQVGVIPLGGYVRMAGEELGSADENPPSDTLPAKSVNQRFFIFSGGVLMNLAFGVVVFPILFGIGVPFTRPSLGEPLPGGPAWRAGLVEGTEVLSVDGGGVWDFLHVLTSVAIGDPEGVDLEVLPPGATEPRHVRLVPEKSEQMGLSHIGVGRPYDPERRLRIQPDSAAWNAGLRDGDRLLGVEGGVPGLGPIDQYLIATRDGGPVRVRVANDEGERVVLVVPTVQPVETPRLLGITPPRNRVEATRGAQWPTIGLRAGDLLVSVDGHAVQRLGDLQLALASAAPGALLVVRRDERSLTLSLPDLDLAARLALAGDVALVADVDSTAVLAEPERAGALAGLRDRDRILRIDGQAVEDFGDVTALVKAAADQDRAAQLEIERRPEDPGALPLLLEIEAKPGARPLPLYGFNVEPDRYVFQAKSLGESVSVGLACSWKMVEDSWLTLKRMLLRDVGAEHLGGIITIGVVSYDWAQEGLAKLFYFLCMLSINLAFINVLPIPVLDGGHLFFLLIEKIKGSPVSERVLAYSQVVGVVVILSLMVYVTFNDIQRWFF